MSDTTAQMIEDFLAGDAFAVVGASRKRTKYGNMVLRAYLQSGRQAYPVNRAGGEIDREVGDQIRVAVQSSVCPTSRAFCNPSKTATRTPPRNSCR